MDGVVQKGEFLENGICKQLSTLSITADVEQKESTEIGICEQFSTLSSNGDEQEQVVDNSEKDPRKIARKYQMDLCTKALEENVIVYLETGCGKTHIAVLLIYEMRHLIKKPQKDICIFLAPTVALVQQQAKVIEDSINFKVGIFCGSSKKMKSHHNWEKEIAEYEVLAMTPDILLHNLSHRSMKMEQIALLIFDECHYAQLESNHPYAEIMKLFYKRDVAKLPRILGMTASPKLGKCGSINGLQTLLQAKVYTVEDKHELEKFVTSPKVNIYYYGSEKNGQSTSCNIYSMKLEEILYQSMSVLRKDLLDQNVLRSTKKSLQNLHSNLTFSLENLGLWGALQASYIFLKGDHNEQVAMVERETEESNVCYKYVQHVASFLASHLKGESREADLSCIEVLEEPYFSSKLLRLIGILSNFRLQPDMKCIIFVSRIVIARSLTYILRNLKLLSSWKCDFLVGVHSGLKSRKSTDIILEKFRSGKLNLLIATKVGEEGLDIQTCCLVIRFDLPETVASFIQSRGRARMALSEYALLVDRGNPIEIGLIEHLKKDEAQMIEEISMRKASIPITEFDEKTYEVDTTGAKISSVTSVSLLHHYSAKLPHDEYFNPKPEFFYFDDENGTVCSVILPANAPIHQIVSSPQTSKEEAKKDVCLKACQSLHEVGALTDYLLPEQDSEDDELIEDSSSNEEKLRGELHEMLIPAALKKPWTEAGHSTCFNCYYIEFCPTPADRIYRKFGLFVKEPLPEEAGKMKVDLCLDRGRTVRSQLTSTGRVRFDKDEITAAEMFQKMSFKMILDRHEFIPEYVSLEKDDVYEPGSSTFYLLLPIVPEEHGRISVDWALIKRCLSSPIFKHPHINVGDESSRLSNCLHLINDHFSVGDVVDSLVYVPCKDIFYFIAGVFPEKNAHSLHDDSKTHVALYSEKFGIDLAHPGQPLLKAKQLFVMDNLLRKKRNSDEWREKVEHFIELPPEVCQLKIIGFSKDIGSSLSLLPSIMHRLESFLVAIELKDKLVASFPEGAEVNTFRILEALTTERCSENFSYERLEVLGDAFLKFAVGRHVFLQHVTLDEGQLTRRRSSLVKNSNLLKLATMKNLQVYIRDQSFEPKQFFLVGRRCPLRCTKETEESIHSDCFSKKGSTSAEASCNKSHHWLYNKTVSDVLEALVGAFIVESGFKAAVAFLNWVGLEVDLDTSQIDDICSASRSFLPLTNHIDVNALESALGYKFANKGLLIQAFVHPSFNNHLGGCYQRLEFLGDAVLDYMITSYLFSVYPNLKPGHLTDLRSTCVSNISFSYAAGRWSFDKFIICDSAVLQEAIARYVTIIGRSGTGDWHTEEKACPKALGDLVESYMGALYLDTGFNLDLVWGMMQSFLHPIISVSKLQFNPVRELNELCQSYHWEVKFSSVRKNGKYAVEAVVDEREVTASASAINVSKKAAERMASRELYEYLKTQGYRSKAPSLEEVLRNSTAMEPMLIGYDETPYHGTTKPGALNVPQDSQSSSNATPYRINEISGTRRKPSFPTIRERSMPQKPLDIHVAQPPLSNGCKAAAAAVDPSNGRAADTSGTGGPSSITAKSRLYETCTANFWRPPVFECCMESGPSHLREFIYKVVLQTGKLQSDTLEFYGGPLAKKKDAAEQAAEAALWFLQHEGYAWDKKRKNRK